MSTYNTRAEYLVAAKKHLRRQQAILSTVRRWNTPMPREVAACEAAVCDALDILWEAQEKRWLA